MPPASSQRHIELMSSDGAAPTSPAGRRTPTNDGRTHLFDVLELGLHERGDQRSERGEGALRSLPSRGEYRMPVAHASAIARCSYDRRLQDDQIAATIRVPE